MSHEPPGPVRADDSSASPARTSNASHATTGADSFAVASHEAADASRRGGGCFLVLALLSTAAFLWKWWDVGQALVHGREVRMHVVLVPFYEWLGRPGILLCGGLCTALFAALAIAGFSGHMRRPDAEP